MASAEAVIRPINMGSVRSQMRDEEGSGGRARSERRSMREDRVGAAIIVRRKGKESGGFERVSEVARGRNSIVKSLLFMEEHVYVHRAGKRTT